MKYYAVTAKFGHVGKSRYFEWTICVEAENKDRASDIVLEMKRLKRDHKDVILNNEEITYTQFLDGKRKTLEQPYFRCLKSIEQKEFWSQIEPFVKMETKSQLVYRAKNKRYDKDRVLLDNEVDKLDLFNESMLVEFLRENSGKSECNIKKMVLLFGVGEKIIKLHLKKLICDNTITKIKKNFKNKRWDIIYLFNNNTKDE